MVTVTSVGSGCADVSSRSSRRRSSTPLPTGKVDCRRIASGFLLLGRRAANSLRVLADEAGGAPAGRGTRGHGAAPADVFEAIAREVAELLRPRLVQIHRWEPDGSVTVAGTWGDGPDPFPAHLAVDDPSLDALTEAMQTGEPVRIEDVAGARGRAGRGSGPRPPAHRWSSTARRGATSASRWRRACRCPIGIESGSRSSRSWWPTAISSSEPASSSRGWPTSRRACGAWRRSSPAARRPRDVFDAVAAELGRLLDVGSSGLVRFEDEIAARSSRLGAARRGGPDRCAAAARRGERHHPGRAHRPAGARRRLRHGGQRRDRATRRAGCGPARRSARPILVAGPVWGAMVAAALEGDSLPPDTEARLEQFTELIGTAIANTDARVELARLADEQAALRRVATLVAEEAPAADVLAKVAEEVAGVSRGRDRLRDPALRRRRHGDRGRGVGRAAGGRHPRRRAAADRRQRRDGQGVPRAAPRAHRRLRRRGRADRRARPAPRDPRRGRLPDRRPRPRSGARWSSPTTRASRSRRTPSGASRSSRTWWRRRSPTRRRGPSCNAWPSSRRRCAGSRRSSPRRPRRPTCSTRSSSRWRGSSERRRSG